MSSEKQIRTKQREKRTAEQQTTRALALEGKALLVRVLSAGGDDGGSFGAQHAAMASIPTSAELFSGDIILLGDQAPSTTVRELKVLVASKCTIVSFEMRSPLPSFLFLMLQSENSQVIYLAEGPEDLELLDSMTVAEAMGFAASTTELKLLVLCKTPVVKVVAAEQLGIKPSEITDDHLNGLCDSLMMADAPPDELDLSNCSQLSHSSLSRLAQLSTVSVLCLAGCSGISGTLAVACLQAMEGLEVRSLFMFIAPQFHSPQ